MQELNWKNVESLNKPLEIDKNLSDNGVYLRRNILGIITEDSDGNEQIKYSYEESYLTNSEYEAYILSKSITDELLDKEDSVAYKHREEKMNTGVLYSNGHKYKPKYIVDYKKIMDDVNAALDLITKAGATTSPLLGKTFNVYDETGTTENVVEMNIAQIVDLYFFLYTKKEEYYNEYKIEKELETSSTS